MHSLSALLGDLARPLNQSGSAAPLEGRFEHRFHVGKPVPAKKMVHLPSLHKAILSAFREELGLGPKELLTVGQRKEVARRVRKTLSGYAGKHVVPATVEVHYTAGKNQVNRNALTLVLRKALELPEVVGYEAHRPLGFPADVHPDQERRVLRLFLHLPAGKKAHALEVAANFKELASSAFATAERS